MPDQPDAAAKQQAKKRKVSVTVAPLSNTSALHAALADRGTRDHGGVPVGCLLVPKARVNEFQKLLKPHKFQLLGVDARVAVAYSLPADSLILHLPPAVVQTLDSPDDSELSLALSHFISATGASFFPGVRRQDAIFGRKPDLVSSEQQQSRFTFVEIFAGIGGFRQGLEPLGGRCVLASEIDQHASNTYRSNWPEPTGSGTTLVGDITAVNEDDIPSFDLLSAGFPCQAFSIRGEQPGLADERGHLYKELVRLLRAHRPRSFLFENVVGLVTTEGGSRSRSKAPLANNDRELPDLVFESGEVLARILKEFEECGYAVSWKVINARQWLPQCRERVYIVGFRNDLNITMSWDAICGSAENSSVRDILLTSDSLELQNSELTTLQWQKLQAQNDAFPRWGGKPCPMTERAVQIDGKAPTLSSSYHNVSSFSTKYVFEEADGTLRGAEAPSRPPRFLSPRECARLMGFPDAFNIPIGERETAAFYQQIGNAVCPPVIQAIGSEMMRLVECCQQGAPAQGPALK